MIIPDPNNYRDILDGYIEIFDVTNDIVEFTYLNNYKQRLCPSTFKLPIKEFEEKYGSIKKD